MSASQGFHLSVALNGAGSHPAAPARPFTPEEYTRLVRGAETGLLDFITVDDGPGRLDSALLLALAARVTERIGLVPLGPTTGEPAAWATRIATLDHLSAGRAGVRPRVAAGDSERARLAQLFGTPEGDRWTDRLFAQAGEFLTEAAEAWDAGAPSPQGRPPVALLAHATVPYRLAAEHGDVVFVTPSDTAALVAVRAEVEALREEAGRPAGALRVFADVEVVLGGSQEAADARLAGLEEAAGAPFTSDAAVFSGTPDGLADLLEEWFREGGADGFRLRPAVLPDDADAITAGLVPVLQRRGLFRTAYSARTLRGHLGLDAVGTPAATEGRPA
ncbi:LLM class flavin-dependent oxidoreductase [Streptomyces sp. NPDC056796]|uniref:LLM class flavin-dependent oxidoreductase n=1 Tax=Streptomyces sp. NPDC056796 TaxID=3345947 RepID=UPI0036B20FBE